MAKKIYHSFEQFISEFKKSKGFNDQVPENVVSLWNSIIDYGDANMELGSEGNSGEFHDESEYKALQKDFKLKRLKLINNFSKLTGWMPLFVSYNSTSYVLYKNENGGEASTWYEGAWDFVNI